MADFEAALAEVKPAFGAVVDTLETYRLNGMIDSGDTYRHLRSTCHTLVEQVRFPHLTGKISCILQNYALYRLYHLFALSLFTRSF